MIIRGLGFQQLTRRCLSYTGEVSTGEKLVWRTKLH